MAYELDEAAKKVKAQWENEKLTKEQIEYNRKNVGETEAERKNYDSKYGDWSVKPTFKLEDGKVKVSGSSGYLKSDIVKQAKNTISDYFKGYDLSNKQVAEALGKTLDETNKQIDSYLNYQEYNKFLKDTGFSDDAYRNYALAAQEADPKNSTNIMNSKKKITGYGKNGKKLTLTPAEWLDYYKKNWNPEDRAQLWMDGAEALARASSGKGKDDDLYKALPYILMGSKETQNIPAQVLNQLNPFDEGGMDWAKDAENAKTMVPVYGFEDTDETSVLAQTFLRQLAMRGLEISSDVVDMTKNPWFDLGAQSGAQFFGIDDFENSDLKDLDEEDYQFYAEWAARLKEMYPDVSTHGVIDYKKVLNNYLLPDYYGTNPEDSEEKKQWAENKAKEDAKMLALVDYFARSGKAVDDIREREEFNGPWKVTTKAGDYTGFGAYNDFREKVKKFDEGAAGGYEKWVQSNVDDMNKYIQRMSVYAPNAASTGMVAGTIATFALEQLALGWLTGGALTATNIADRLTRAGYRFASGLGKTEASIRLGQQILAKSPKVAEVLKALAEGGKKGWEAAKGLDAVSKIIYVTGEIGTWAVKELGEDVIRGLVDDTIMKKSFDSQGNLDPNKLVENIYMNAIMAGIGHGAKGALKGLASIVDNASTRNIDGVELNASQRHQLDLFQKALDDQNRRIQFKGWNEDGNPVISLYGKTKILDQLSPSEKTMATIDEATGAVMPTASRTIEEVMSDDEVSDGVKQKISEAVEEQKADNGDIKTKIEEKLTDDEIREAFPDGIVKVGDQTIKVDTKEFTAGDVGRTTGKEFSNMDEAITGLKSATKTSDFASGVRGILRHSVQVAKEFKQAIQDFADANNMTVRDVMIAIRESRLSGQEKIPGLQELWDNSWKPLQEKLLDLQEALTGIRPTEHNFYFRDMLEGTFKLGDDGKFSINLDSVEDALGGEASFDLSASSTAHNSGKLGDIAADRLEYDPEVLMREFVASRMQTIWQTNDMGKVFATMEEAHAAGEFNFTEADAKKSVDTTKQVATDVESSEGVQAVQEMTNVSELDDDFGSSATAEIDSEIEATKARIAELEKQSEQTVVAKTVTNQADAEALIKELASRNDSDMAKRITSGEKPDEIVSDKLRSGINSINKKFHAGEALTDDEAKNADFVDSLFVERTTGPKTLYRYQPRGTSGRLKKGKTITPNFWQFTSENIDRATTYKNISRGGVMYKYNIPENSPILDMTGFRQAADPENYTNWNEILLPRGVEYRITNVTRPDVKGKFQGNYTEVELTPVVKTSQLEEASAKGASALKAKDVADMSDDEVVSAVAKTGKQFQKNLKDAIIKWRDEKAEPALQQLGFFNGQGGRNTLHIDAASYFKHNNIEGGMSDVPGGLRGLVVGRDSAAKQRLAPKTIEDIAEDASNATGVKYTPSQVNKILNDYAATHSGKVSGKDIKDFFAENPDAKIVAWQGSEKGTGKAIIKREGKEYILSREAEQTADNTDSAKLNAELASEKHKLAGLESTRRAILNAETFSDDEAKIVDEISTLNIDIDRMKAEIKDRQTLQYKKQTVQDFHKLDYETRKQMVKEFVRHNPDYVVAYRNQNTGVDDWYSNGSGVHGDNKTFDSYGSDKGDLKDAVWLTTDEEWAEGKERASAQAYNGAPEQTVVIPIKRSLIVDGGGEQPSYDPKLGEADMAYFDNPYYSLKRFSELNGNKIVQTRATQLEDEWIAARDENGGVTDAMRYRLNPEFYNRTELVLFKDQLPNVKTDGEKAVVDFANENAKARAEVEMNGRVNQRAIRDLETDIKTTEDYIKGLQEQKAAMKNEAPAKPDTSDEATQKTQLKQEVESNKKEILDTQKKFNASAKKSNAAELISRNSGYSNRAQRVDARAPIGVNFLPGNPFGKFFSWVNDHFTKANSIKVEFSGYKADGSPTTMAITAYNGGYKMYAEAGSFARNVIVDIQNGESLWDAIYKQVYDNGFFIEPSKSQIKKYGALRVQDQAAKVTDKIMDRITADQRFSHVFNDDGTVKSTDGLLAILTTRFMGQGISDFTKFLRKANWDSFTKGQKDWLNARMYEMTASVNKSTARKVIEGLMRASMALRYRSNMYWNFKNGQLQLTECQRLFTMNKLGDFSATLKRLVTDEEYRQKASDYTYILAADSAGAGFSKSELDSSTDAFVKVGAASVFSKDGILTNIDTVKAKFGEIDDAALASIHGGEYAKNFILIAGFLAAGERQGLSGAELDAYVRNRFNVEALAGTKVGRIGLTDSRIGQFTFMYLGFPIRDLTLQVHTIRGGGTMGGKGWKKFVGAADYLGKMLGAKGLMWAVEAPWGYSLMDQLNIDPFGVMEQYDPINTPYEEREPGWRVVDYLVKYNPLLQGAMTNTAADIYMKYRAAEEEARANYKEQHDGSTEGFQWSIFQDGAENLNDIMRGLAPIGNAALGYIPGYTAYSRAIGEIGDLDRGYHLSQSGNRMYETNTDLGNALWGAFTGRKNTANAQAYYQTPNPIRGLIDNGLPGLGQQLERALPIKFDSLLAGKNPFRRFREFDPVDSETYDDWFDGSYQDQQNWTTGLYQFREEAQQIQDKYNNYVSEGREVNTMNARENELADLRKRLEAYAQAYVAKHPEGLSIGKQNQLINVLNMNKKKTLDQAFAESQGEYTDEWDKAENRYMQGDFPTPYGLTQNKQGEISYAQSPQLQQALSQHRYGISSDAAPAIKQLYNSQKYSTPLGNMTMKEYHDAVYSQLQEEWDKSKPNYDRITKIQEAYLEEISKNVIQPILNTYGSSVLSAGKSSDITQEFGKMLYSMIPSNEYRIDKRGRQIYKSTPYMTVDIPKWLNKNFGAYRKSTNTTNRKVSDRLSSIRSSINQGHKSTAKAKARALIQDIGNGKASVSRDELEWLQGVLND